MEAHISRASAVVVQEVPAAPDWFIEWQYGVTRIAEGFAGYRGTEVYPPGDNQRAQWVEKLKAQIGEFDLKALPGGFGYWFAGLSHAPERRPPPSWKMALTVLLGFYPTVMTLTLFTATYMEPLGMALAMLIGNALSVCILQWAVMPALNSMLAPWLRANAKEKAVLSVGGLFLILVLLTVMAFLFRQVTG